MGSLVVNTLGSELATIAVAHTVCPRCEAQPNQACESLAGKKTTTHVSRWSPLLQAWNMGYDEGQSRR